MFTKNTNEREDYLKKKKKVTAAHVQLAVIK